jgi:hypothetical protein
MAAHGGGPSTGRQQETMPGRGIRSQPRTGSGRPGVTESGRPRADVGEPATGRAGPSAATGRGGDE